MSDESLFGRAQSLLDALREKGLHLPNPTRVDGDTDALAALAAEVRTLAADPALTVTASFDTEGRLFVCTRGPAAALAQVVSVEVRSFAPWRHGPALRRVRARLPETLVDAVERDGPVNVVLLDVGGVPLAWCTAGAR